MKLAIVGGGGFRVPLIYQALITDHHDTRIDTVCLYDIDSDRLATISAVLAQQGADVPDAPHVTTSTDLAATLAGADFVFSAIRVGGLAGRVCDERVALNLHLLGQETTGPGGLVYAMRTVPHAAALAESVRHACPDAWVINFTNPAGIITETMRRTLGDKVIGICDSPSALANRATRALDLPKGSCRPIYAGLNHLGWLTGLLHDGVDVLPRLLADPARLTHVEEARLFGLDWVTSLGALPNEYLYYYYYNRESITAIEQAPSTRGEYLAQSQKRFYDEAADDPHLALKLWRDTYQTRNDTYMAEARDATGSGDREQVDIDEGGYERVALDLMRALIGDDDDSVDGPHGGEALILNVPNRGTLSGLDDDAVIEVPCRVGPAGPVPIRAAGLGTAELGLVLQVKSVERLSIEAAMTGSRMLAVKALALHPLVDSVNVARELIDGYVEAEPDLAAVLGV